MLWQRDDYKNNENGHEDISEVDDNVDGHNDMTTEITITTRINYDNADDDDEVMLW